MSHFVTRIIVKMLKNHFPAFKNVPINATLFKGDLLESYELPTISTILHATFLNAIPKNAIVCF